MEDILKGLLGADFSNVSDPVGDILAGLNRFADFRSAPDIGGLTGKMRGVSHYFPDLLAPVSAPTGSDAFTSFLKTLQVLSHCSFFKRPDKCLDMVELFSDHLAGVKHISQILAIL